MPALRFLGRIPLISVIPLALMLMGAAYVVASDGMTANQATPITITGPDGVCKTVTNSSGTGLSEYIPTATIAEWQSFVANPPAGVTLAACGETIQTKTAVLPANRAFFGCAADPVSDILYCLGGRPSTTGTPTTQITAYDPVADVLTIKTAVLPVAESHHACAMSSANGKIYCFGGQNGNSGYSAIYEYTPSTDTIATKVSMPQARSQFSCVDYPPNAKIYCFGGVTNGTGTYYSSILEYNPSTNTITTKSAKLPSARRGHSCAFSAATNKIYCFGGATSAANSSAISQIVEYNPLTDSIATKSATLPFARYDLACTNNSTSNKIYCFGGAYLAGGSTWTAISEIDQYDAVANTMTVKTSKLPSGREAPACSISPIDGNTAYCFGGQTALTSFTNQIIQYSP